MGQVETSSLIPVGKLDKLELANKLTGAVKYLFSLSDKPITDEKAKFFAQELAEELPVNFPHLTLSDIKSIFRNAIRGEFGPLNSIRLVDIYQWLRKASHAPKNGQRIDSSVLIHPNTSTSHDICWEKQCYLAYQVYLSQGLRLEDFHDFLYDRLLMDNIIAMRSYEKYKVYKSEEDMPEIKVAKKRVVLDYFEWIKSQGVGEIYAKYKNEQ